MMNRNQIKEINELLVNNSDALTAFYDEAMDVGFLKGVAVATCGFVIAEVVHAGVKMYKLMKENNYKLEIDFKKKPKKA